MQDLAIQLQNVSKHFSHFELKNINLTLPKGQIMGFVGANGAGKSTTIRLIMGLMQADKGNISVLGQSMPQMQTQIKRDVGFSSEEMKLYGAQNLAWHIHFIKNVYPNWDDNYARELLHRFDLNLEQKIKQLSKGQHIKAQLLLVLARQPKLLVLDEPTTGLDPVARQEVNNELALILKDEERTVLFSSHNTADVERISDQITFIDRGRLIDSQDKESYLENWRRIQLELPTDLPLQPSGSVIEVEQNGRIASVISNQFEPLILDAYQQQNIKILAVETMSLEEIFLANVNYRRQVQQKGAR
ncbi:ABC transporter ATP-binding protein [Paraglaciecola aquimarina]|uniref:ABC transporter ATP-binding protein n=1 Tax=Paraglaciecola aquimarina TaxID=1235557 RepID=A0ABU3SWD9_9ALTE|nr:ABC transporter ATP-binding protein [Paraglaciecola aquimarina]MDU0354331.1 ABC transporter ATP-binding protein [Paraglaciecola aquimarina]